MNSHSSPDVHAALLVAVVRACGPVVEALVDEVARELGELLRGHLVMEALLHRLDRLLAGVEARQLAPDADEGGAYQEEELLLVAPCLEHAAHHEQPEVTEPGRGGATHEVGPLPRELERCRLEADVLAGRIGEEEAKVDVYLNCMVRRGESVGLGPTPERPFFGVQMERAFL